MARPRLLDLMKRRSPTGELADRHGRSLTASAAVVNLTDRTEGNRLADKALRQPWQDEAWTYRRNIGEVRYVQDWLGVAVSRMRLYVGALVEGADTPVPIDQAVDPADESDDLEPISLPPGLVQDAKDAIDALGDTGPLLARATISLEVVGEFYLVGYIDAFGRERWEARNIGEMLDTDWGWVIKGTPQAGRNMSTRPARTQEGGSLLDPETSYIARIWRSDAQWTDLADAPMAAVRGHCELLLLLERKARGNARSRLSAPLLLIPSESDFVPTIDPVTLLPVPVRPIEQVVQDHIVTPIGDESAAGAVAPVIVKTPKDAIEAWRTIDLGRNSGPEDRAEREEALTRILQGIDADAEIVKGMSGVKFANQQAITQDRFRYLVEPKVLTLGHALTTTYLRVRLVSRGWAPELVDQLVVWYDPSDLVTNPDQAKDALAVYGAGELSGRALRRYHGFPEQDAPTDEERDRFAQLKTFGRVAAPDGTVESIAFIEAETPAVEAPAEDAPADPVVASAVHAARQTIAQARRLQALTASASQQPSDLGARLLRTDVSVFQKLQGAADAAMGRALERAGARARSKARAAGNTTGTASPNDRLVSELGPDGIQRLGLTDQDLLDGDPFGPVAARFEAWAEQAFEAGLRAYAKALGLSLPPADPNAAQRSVVAAGALVADAGSPPFSDLGGLDFISLREQAQLDRGTASAELVRRLTQVAADRLYTPEFSDPQGEADPTTTVPPGIIRAALARAGGADSHPASGGIDDMGRAVSAQDPQPGGIASGWTLREAAAAAGLKPYAYAWAHGTTARPFDPHLDLDGQVFESQADARLAKDPASFPSGTTSWFPGDHWGCTCWTEFLFPDPFAGMTRSEAARVRASQQARNERGHFVGRNDHPDDTPGSGTTPQHRT